MTSLFDQNEPNEADREALALKWKDKPLDEVIKAKVESDLYIKNLTSTMDQMRADLLETREKANTQAKLQDLLDRMEGNQREPVALTPANDNAHQPTFDMNEIESMVSKKIQETEANKIATSNFNQVETKLKELYGNNYKSVLQEKATALGLSTEDVDTLARKSPTAFFNVLGMNQQSHDNFQSPTLSSTRNDSFTPNVKKRTWTYWQELRKTDPKAYYDPKNSLQRMQDAESLGETFKDGDYKLFGH